MLTPRHCASTPDGRLTKGRTGLAQAWNSYFEDENRHRQHIQAENNRLQATIDEYVKSVHALQHERAALLTANENLEKGLDRSNQKLDETTGKMEALATKAQEYRKRLNDATDEQQRLYTKSKKMIQDAREELEKSAESREAMVQAELDKSESARRELHDKVTAAVAEAREKITHRELMSSS
jgi:chromosome segregation ATPase